MTHEPWTTLDQAAEHVGCAKRTIKRWHANRVNNGFPSRVVGAVVRVKLSAIDTWLDAQGHEDASDRIAAEIEAIKCSRRGARFHPLGIGATGKRKEPS